MSSFQIFFCTSSSRALKFRPAEAPDYLASFTRQYLLSSFPQREVDIQLIQGEEYKSKKDEEWVLYDARNPLEEWQRASGVEYWNCEIVGFRSAIYSRTDTDFL